MVGCFPVNRINHHLTGSDFFHCFYPGKHIFIRCIIHVLSLITSFQKHRLYDAVSFELFQLFDDFSHRIFSVRTVQQIDIFFIHCIQFQNIIIYLVQCFEHGRTINKRRVTQYAHFCFREILITERKRIFYNFREVGMRSWFTVSGKGQYIRSGTVHLHIFQFFFKSRTNFFTGRKKFLRTMFGIETTLTINAVE